MVAYSLVLHWSNFGLLIVRIIHQYKWLYIPYIYIYIYIHTYTYTYIHTSSSAVLFHCRYIYIYIYIVTRIDHKVSSQYTDFKYSESESTAFVFTLHVEDYSKYKLQILMPCTPDNTYQYLYHSHCPWCISKATRMQYCTNTNLQLPKTSCLHCELANS